MCRPLRVLHVTSTLDCGGIENWLMNLLRISSRKRIQFDFMVNRDREHFFSKEAKGYGSKIFSAGSPSNFIKYFRNMMHVIRESGPYDVIHCHQAPIHGYILFLAWLARVPVRVAHARSAFDWGESQFKWIHRASRFLIWHFANLGFGVSSNALDSMLGKKWKYDPRFQVLYSGIVLNSFDENVRHEVRRNLGVTEDTTVIGHVGRFSRMKNHEFFIRVAKELIELEPHWEFVLIGSGKQLPAAKYLVNKLGLGDCFHFLGIRNDVMKLLRGFDGFVFPSLWEGLPTALIEAQAAGLPCIYSDRITLEVEVIPKIMLRLPLDLGPKTWAKRIYQFLKETERISCQSIKKMKLSKFNISNTLAKLYHLYFRVLARRK